MAEKALSAWLYELKSHGLLSLNFTNEVYATHIGHWVEINWSNVIEIGCAIKNCTNGLGPQFPGNWSFVVCVYNPGWRLFFSILITLILGGNYINDLIYVPGEPCTNCRFHPNSKCDQKLGMCYVESNSSTSTSIFHSSSTSSSSSTQTHELTKSTTTSFA